MSAITDPGAPRCWPSKRKLERTRHGRDLTILLPECGLCRLRQTGRGEFDGVYALRQGQAPAAALLPPLSCPLLRTQRHAPLSGAVAGGEGRVSTGPYRRGL